MAHHFAVSSCRRLVGAGLAAWLLGSGLVIALGVVVVMPGCVAGPRISDRDVRFVDYDRLQAALADPTKTITIIDVRSPRDFDQGHIPGAVNVPLASLKGLTQRQYAADMVVIYATSENDLSTAAVKKLITAGYDHVFDFRGGIDTWRQRGGDVMTTTGGTRLG